MIVNQNKLTLCPIYCEWARLAKHTTQKQRTIGHAVWSNTVTRHVEKMISMMVKVERRIPVSFIGKNGWKIKFLCYKHISIIHSYGSN